MLLFACIVSLVLFCILVVSFQKGTNLEKSSFTIGNVSLEHGVFKIYDANDNAIFGSAHTEQYTRFFIVE